MKKILLILTLFLSFIFADITQSFPKLDGRVIDTINLLSSESKEKLTSILKNHEDETSNQIVVVILDSLNGYEIEEYSYQLGRYWGIGQKGLNNGVLLVISQQDRKLRIEVGYGLEGALTDKISYEIINYTLKPKFREGKFGEGIFKAIDEIIQAIKGEYTAKTKVNNEDVGVNGSIVVLYFLVIFFSIFLNAFSTKFKSHFLYKITKSSMLSAFFGFITFIMAQSFTSYYTGISAIVFLAVFIFNIIYLRKVDFDKIDEYSNGSSSRNSTGFGGFSSSSSGGFSGGGGGFGGGGASGSW
uniref:TPM domain-containing protein n=1 Tax=Aliarcobacter sp. TaxID=2321116 RepID=UPI0040485CE5